MYSLIEVTLNIKARQYISSSSGVNVKLHRLNKIIQYVGQSSYYTKPYLRLYASMGSLRMHNFRFLYPTFQHTEKIYAQKFGQNRQNCILLQAICRSLRQVISVTGFLYQKVRLEIFSPLISKHIETKVQRLLILIVKVKLF